MSDNVNHPEHYSGKKECIDVMLETQGKEAVKGFCVCNAIKYLYRQRQKGGLEDIKKAVWYLNKYIELCNENKDIKNSSPFSIEHNDLRFMSDEEIKKEMDKIPESIRKRLKEVEEPDGRKLYFCVPNPMEQIGQEKIEDAPESERAESKDSSAFDFNEYFTKEAMKMSDEARNKEIERIKMEIYELAQKSKIDRLNAN